MGVPERSRRNRGVFAPNRRSHPLVTLLVAAALTAGCGGGTEPDSVNTSLSGVWAARARAAEDFGLWRFTLAESGGSVSGTYTVLNPQPGQARQVSVDGTVDGRFQSPSVSLEFRVTPDVVMDCEYQGAMATDGQSINGTITCATGAATVAAGPLELERAVP